MHDDSPTTSTNPLHGRETAADSPERGAADGLHKPGDMIGRYKLLAPLGEGGFGVVWLAEQTEPVRRRVALKVIKPGMDSRAVIARFEAERQALALMNHPNVAKVFDAGMTPANAAGGGGGRPYFVMEHVKGAPITEYCDTNRLTVEKRLRLFAVVCDAVQHAHMKGIIHRDLKPSNILVSIADSGEARPVVIDFGVAKALAGRLTDRTLYTERGVLIGTLEYMSPEQAEMAETSIDTRSDVYSLGVVLYELLTGAVPFDSGTLRSAGHAAVQKMIREVDPPRPSRRLSTMGQASEAAAAARQTRLDELTSKLRRELEWIPLKALRKSPAERYRSASELADDVGNYLANRPLIAGPESAGYKIRKFVRRNKGAVAAAGVIGASLVLAAGVSVWFGLSEARQRAEAVRQQGRAQANAAAEVKARTRAEAINTFVVEALQSSDPNAGGQQDTTIAQAMQNAIKQIESGAFKDEPETEAVLRDTIATIFQNNGRYDQAQPQFERALAIRERVLKGDDPLLAESLNNLAGLYVLQGQLDRAEPLHKRALAIFEKVNGPDDPSVAGSLGNLAALYASQGKYDLAEPLCKRSLALLEKNLGPDHRDLPTSMFNLASVYQRQGKFDLAEPLYKRSLAISEKTLGPDHPDVASTLNNLASLYQSQGRYDLAEPACMRSLSISEKALGPDHPNVAAGLSNLAALYKAQGKVAQAEPLYERVLAILRRTFGPDHAEVANGLVNLSLARQSLGKAAEARQGFDEAVAMGRRLWPQGSAALARVLWRSGSERMANRDAAAALSELQEAVAMAEKFLPPEHPQVKEYSETLGKCKMELGT